MCHPRLLFRLFLVSSNKQNKFYNKLIWASYTPAPSQHFYLNLIAADPGAGIGLVVYPLMRKAEKRLKLSFVKVGWLLQLWLEMNLPRVITLLNFYKIVNMFLNNGGFAGLGVPFGCPTKVLSSNFILKL